MTSAYRRVFARTIGKCVACLNCELRDRVTRCFLRGKRPRSVTVRCSEKPRNRIVVNVKFCECVYVFGTTPGIKLTVCPVLFIAVCNPFLRSKTACEKRTVCRDVSVLCRASVESVSSRAGSRCVARAYVGKPTSDLLCFVWLVEQKA